MLKLEKDEKVIHESRKHWAIYIVEMFVLALLLFLPWFGWHVLNIDQFISLEGRNYHLAVFFYMTWFLLLWSYAFIVWTNHFLDRWVVTDRRVIDIEQLSLFHREENTFRIEMLQDIGVEVKGPVATLLNYGTLHIQTAGDDLDLKIEYVPNPRKVRQIISDIHDKYLRETHKDADHKH